LIFTTSTSSLPPLGSSLQEYLKCLSDFVDKLSAARQDNEREDERRRKQDAKDRGEVKNPFKKQSKGAKSKTAPSAALNAGDDKRPLLES
jgi:hypothetical protein